MKVLLVKTRPLCYFSAGFFMDRIEEALEQASVECLCLELFDTESFDSLEKYLGLDIDAIVDINSKLPYVLMEDGSFLLDHFDAPFYNYILDHPLYHHPGLSFELKNYHAIGIDKYHCAYMEKHYPHLKSVTYLPIPGTPPFTPRPYEQRKDELLFCGTYIPKKQLEDELKVIIDTYGSEYKKLVYELMDSWNPYMAPLEEVVEEYKSDRPFPELMNLIYPVDRILRNDYREKILSKLAGELPLTVVGEGWESSALGDAVTLMSGVFYDRAIQLNGMYKWVLDINPGFICGCHDRASNAMAAGCTLFSNMSPDALGGLEDKRELIYYKGDEVSPVIDAITGSADLKEIAKNGYEFYLNNLRWDENIVKTLV